MKRLLLVLLLLVPSTALAQPNFYGDGFYPDKDSSLTSGGGSLLGPLAWCVITQVADDATPSIGVLGGCAAGTGGNILETSSANTGPLAVTDLDAPIVGMILFIVGTGGANPTTIADGGNFNLERDWEGSADNILELYVQADNDYVEVTRHNGLRFFDAAITVNGSIIGADADTIANSSAGAWVFWGTGATSAEDLTYTFGATADQVDVASSTGVATVDWGTLDQALAAMSLAGNLTLEGGGSIVTTSDGDLTLAPNGTGVTILGSDLQCSDYDLINPDVIYQQPAASDVAPDPIDIHAGNAYSQAAVNTTGAAQDLTGGVGSKKITCVQATASTTTLTFAVTVAGTITTTTITEGTEWDCLTDNDTCCAALETYLDGNIAGFTATAVSDVVWLDPAYTTQGITLTSADGGGTKFAVVDGASGSVRVPSGLLLVGSGTSTLPSIGMLSDPDSGIRIITNGVRIHAGASRLQITPADIEFKVEADLQDEWIWSTSEATSFNGDVSPVNIADSSGNGVHGGTSEFLGDVWTNGSSTTAGLVTRTPGSQELSVGETLTITSSEMELFSDGGALVSTADPALTNGAANGQLICVMGTSDANRIQWSDEAVNPGSTLELAGGVAFDMGLGDRLCLRWYATGSKWYETSRSDN